MKYTQPGFSDHSSTGIRQDQGRSLGYLPVVVLSSLLAVACPSYAVDIPVSGTIPTSAYEVELSYLGEQTTPSVTLNGPPDTVPSLPYRPFLFVLYLLPGLAPSQSFGPCRGEMARAGETGVITLTFHEGRTGRCGQRLGLQPDGRLLDVLSYRMLRMRGQATGRVTLVVEDWAAARREDNLSLGTVRGRSI